MCICIYVHTHARAHTGCSKMVKTPYFFERMTFLEEAFQTKVVRYKKISLQILLV